MSKPYAKIVVEPTRPGPSFWRIVIDTDLKPRSQVFPDKVVVVAEVLFDRATARHRARMWSRRLGNIPVEVEE